jgi:cytochrome d ubiquinol oxidase subunit I
VGDVFGSLLAIEGLMAFFLESTFIGIWIFGWEKLPKKVHAAAIWLTAIGASISALWILIANSFMHHPMGYSMVDGRPVMSDFLTLISNPHVWTQFPHTLFAGYSTAAFFVLGISIYHLMKKSNEDFFRKSFKLAAIFGLVSVLGVIGIGHQQAQLMVKQQPMKMAAAEALFETEDPASLSLFTIADEEKREAPVDIRIPAALSFLSYNSFTGEVKGINELQEEMVENYGPGDYVPNITINYWSFRIMVGAGFLMLGLTALALFLIWRKKLTFKSKWSIVLVLSLFLPYLANTTGWLLTELGRQPWVVYGLMKTADAVSPNVTIGMVLASLITFTTVYGILMVVDVILLVKYSKAGPQSDHSSKPAQAKV